MTLKASDIFACSGRMHVNIFPDIEVSAWWGTRKERDTPCKPGKGEQGGSVTESSSRGSANGMQCAVRTQRWLENAESVTFNYAWDTRMYQLWFFFSFFRESCSKAVVS